MNEDNLIVDGNLVIDTDGDAAYVHIDSTEGQSFTVAHNDVVNIDYSIGGQVRGFELLDLGARFPVEELAVEGSEIWVTLEQANSKIERVIFRG